MDEKISNVLHSIIKVIFISVLGIVIFSVCFYKYDTSLYPLNIFPLKNYIYFLIAIVMIFVGLLIWSFIRKKMSAISKIKIRHIVIVSLFFSIIQFIINYKRYFFYGWDAGFLFDQVTYELDNDLANLNSVYFSVYSNNILLFFIYTIVGGITRFFKLNQEVGFLFVNQILNFITAMLIYLVSDRILKNKKIAIMAYVIYQVFIGFSPWFIISYSDTLAILFPLLTIFIFDVILNEKNDNKKNFWMVVWGIEVIVGYMIKPQTLIVFIAIVIVVSINLLEKICCNKSFIKDNIKKYLLYVLLFFATIVIAFNILNQVAISFLRLEIYNEYSFGPYHYIMMGLNNENGGAFNDNDVDFSITYDDVPSRVEAQKDMIKARVNEYGLYGMINHILRKNVINFGDGTFAWYCEGDFNVGLSERNMDSFSLELYNWIFKGTEKYNIFISVCQIIWFIIILLSLLASLLGNKKQISLFVLSGIGIALFQLIFEARARYLFVYAPIYVILASYGFYVLVNKLINLNKK